MANEELLAQIAALGGTELLILIALLIGLSLVLVWPVFLVLKSKRVHGGTKLFWVLMMGTFSWLVYPIYLIVTRKAEQAADQPSGQA
ncbi:MAG: hypothetical protein A2045_09915 [Rhodocyclales bacterium GWA2_65_20]|nr:MAG: hypothetical protein A2045_09915 [Rhodocyclales bacterium GWA2_65_20]